MNVTRVTQRLPVIADNVRRVDSQFLRGDFGVPAVGERLPRAVHALDLKLSEVGLEQLLLVVTELHVEVAVEASFGILFHGFQNGKTLRKKSGNSMSHIEAC